MIAVHLYYSLFSNNNGSSIMIIGSFILILMAISQIQLSILQGINSFYYILCTYSIGILLKIILNYIFVSVPIINIYGVLIGNCAWYLIPAILNHKKIRQRTRVKLYFLKLIFKPLLASIFMALSIFILRKPIEFICIFFNPSRVVNISIVTIDILIGCCIYIYTMILIGGIRRNDIEKISPRIINLMPYFIRKILK